VYSRHLPISDSSNLTPGFDLSFSLIVSSSLTISSESSFEYSCVGHVQRPSWHSWNASKSWLCFPLVSVTSILTASSVDSTLYFISVFCYYSTPSNASHQRLTKGVAFWQSVCMRLLCILSGGPEFFSNHLAKRFL